MMETIWKALRPVQWTKNLFVLAPLVFSHNLFSATAVTRSLITVVLFCLVSSSSYVFNDIQDIEQDRLHPDKKFRPLVTGDLSVSSAMAAWILLLLVGLIGGILLSASVAMILALYWALTLAYSLKLKHHLILDVAVIAVGFVLRVAAGAAAISVPMSNWLIVCTALLALFLVLGKRKHEIAILPNAWGHRHVLVSYDIRILNFSIVLTGIATFVCYVLYTFRQELHPRMLVWTSPFVLFGICRYAYLVFWEGRGGDPARILFADFQVLAGLLLWVTAVVWIIYR